jgi:alpha-tubulin suppressor-like RCC1 family protein
VTKGKLLPTRLQLDLDTDTSLSTTAATVCVYPVDVACGANHSVAVLSDGSVLGWGHRYTTVDDICSSVVVSCVHHITIDCHVVVCVHLSDLSK